MDLAAYVQINDLGKVAKDNNIEVPRLRGYRLMKNEELASAEDIRGLMKDCEVRVCEDLCRAEPYWNGNADGHWYSMITDCICNHYLVETLNENGYSHYTDIRWDRIHGWKRKVLKFEIKKQKRKIQKQFDMWNKYASKENVLYIHARIGGDNWDRYGNELVKQPWFLDKVDDWFDGTYCDIYALINR